jgi:hypothetical protein
MSEWLTIERNSTPRVHLDAQQRLLLPIAKP